MNFTSHMDIVVSVAVGLVNVLTPGEAHGRDYQPPAGPQLTAAVNQTLQDWAPGSRTAVAAEAAQFAGVARSLRAVFEANAAGDADRAARLVNDLLLATGARPVLNRHDGEGWHLHFTGHQDTVVTGWAAGCATGLAVVLGSSLHGRLGVCTAPHCDRVYVDISRNGSRRFCSAACQSRVKAAAFRARA